MTLQAKLIAAFVALLLVGSGVVALGYHERQVGALNARIAALQATNATLANAEARVESVTVVDSVRLTKVLTRYDTARVRDTITYRDTVYVQRAIADSAINACTITLADCQRGWQLADARADSLAVLAKLATPRASTLWAHVHITLGVSAIAAVDDRRLHWGPGVAIGWTP